MSKESLVDAIDYILLGKKSKKNSQKNVVKLEAKKSNPPERKKKLSLFGKDTKNVGEIKMRKRIEMKKPVEKKPISINKEKRHRFSFFRKRSAVKTDKNAGVKAQKIVIPIKVDDGKNAHAFESLKQEEDYKSVLISTKIDELYSLVSHKKVIDIDAASKILRMAESEIEKWAKILEDNNLIEIYYPAFGKIKLILYGEKLHGKNEKKVS